MGKVQKIINKQVQIELDNLTNRLELLEEFKKNWKRLHLNEHSPRQDNP